MEIQFQVKSCVCVCVGKKHWNKLLVDLSDGAIEEDDGGVVEALHGVLPRQLQVVLQTG